MEWLNPHKRGLILSLTLCAFTVASYLFFKPMDDLGPPLFPHFDKFAHFIVFSGLSFILVLALALKYTSVLMTCLILLAIYGGLIEVLQGQFFDRQMSLADWFADLAGCLFTLFLYRSTQLKCLRSWASAR